MKLTDNNLEQHKLPVGSYGFSAAKIDDLGASEYTLVTIVQDASGSVSAFKSDMEECIKNIVKACKYSDRADNLLLRLVTFATRGDRPDVVEVHGFQPLDRCNLDDYTDCIQIGGATPLYDASENAVRATMTYGRTLISQDFSANGFVVIVTDGDNNKSTMTAKDVATALKEAVNQESLESLLSVLVGINITDPHMGQRLAQFQQEAGIAQYVEVADASAKTLAKLMGFISKSISSQSKALGSGQMSTPLPPTI